MKWLEKSIKFLLFATVLMPLIYIPSVLFPFITGKLIYFRSIVEITLALFIVLLAVDNGLRKKTIGILKQPLSILVILFFVSATISTFFAINLYGAFWGNLERGEGLFTMLHYLVFFLIAAAIFERKDWVNYVKYTLLVSLIVAFYAILQVIGIENFPFALDKRNRPWSFLGNASFLASYFVMIVGLAAWIFGHSRCTCHSRESGNLDSHFHGNDNWNLWRWLSLAIGIISVIVIFLTATRGAIVALLVGLVVWGSYRLLRSAPTVIASEAESDTPSVIASPDFSRGRSNLIKRLLRRFAPRNDILIIAAGVLILFFIVFGLTRSNNFWQKVPGLDRFARFSFTQSTVQTRIIALRSSWDGFKENPVIGWGLENYSIAYNKHYDPSYALYEAAWFDRAHNKLADVLVMQGLLGLIFYLGIFGYALRQLLKNNQLPIFILLIMYFAQNLFVFDHHTGYLLFFGVLAFTVNLTANSFEKHVSEQKVNHIVAITALGSVILISYLLYSYNYVPFFQARHYITTKLGVTDVNEIIKKSDEFLYPYTFIQSSLRKDWHDFLLSQNVFENSSPVFEELGTKSINALKEYIGKEPHDPRDYIRLSEAYNDIAKRNPEFIKYSEENLREALKLAPNRQEVYYHLAYTLAGTVKTDEAIKVAEQAVALNPEVARAHYMLGIILSLSSDRVRGEAEIEKAFELERGLFLLPQDSKNILNIYGANFVQYVKARNLAGVRTTIKRLKEFSPEEAYPTLDKLLDLAEQGRWEELEVAVDQITE